MSVKPEGLLGDIKTANVFHCSCYSCFSLFMLFDIKIRLNVIFEKTKRQTFAPNAMAIRDQRHDNKSKQTTSLAGYDATPPIGVALLIT